MKKEFNWTEEQEDFIKLNYSILGAKLCGEKIGKSKSSVFAKANRMGLKSNNNKLKTHKEYEQELFEKEIDYIPLQSYINSHTAILHECFEGHQTLVKPYSVLSGRGCNKCEVIKRTKTHEQYCSEIVFTVLEEYVNSITPIKHKCEKGHVWKSSPNRILSGHGCPSCASFGFDVNKPAILYYIKVTENNLEYYKIGITNKTVQKRFSKDSAKEIKIIKETYYENGQEAKDEESRLFEKYRFHRQHIPEFLKSGGNTELFEFDVLDLDT